MPDNPLILLFVKAPIKGQVKSRLASALGQDIALDLYRTFVLDILAAIETSGIHCTTCYYPPHNGETVSSWLGAHRRYMPQDGNDLGERMEGAFRRAFSKGASRVVLIGSDLPDLPPELFKEAFASLLENGAVIGPARDGGYYLIGFRSDAFLPAVFHGIEWSAATVFARTMAIFERKGRQVHLLPPWQDVDTIDDLMDLSERNRGPACNAPRTMAYLHSIDTDLLTSEVRDANV